MKKYLAAITLIIIILAIAIPFASKNPDGLQKLTATQGTQGNQPYWKGLMNNYSIGTIENSYVSTVVAGIIGILAVLSGTFLLGKLMAPKKTFTSSKDVQ
jgi:hypothetical protein